MVVFVGFARAVGHHGPVGGPVRGIDGRKRLGQRSDLIYLHQNSVADALFDALAQTLLGW